MSTGAGGCGHRVADAHDCFTASCHTLGDEVRRLNEALSECDRQLNLAVAHDRHVPTPEELDVLLSDISAAGYASEAREIVETWTRKWWGVESAFTTKWDAER